MKDFANIDNAVGTFPNVTAADCTGPGETDGTAWEKNTMTDQFGWIQALLTEVGDTPSGSAEEDTDSQILDAIKLLPTDYVIPLTVGQGYTTNWALFDNFWSNSTTAQVMYFPIFLPDVEMDISVSVEVNQVTGEAVEADRMGVILQYTENSGGDSYHNIGSWTYYGDSGTGLKDIVAALTGYTPTIDRAYRIAVKKSANSGTDKIHSITVSKSAA